ncbi:MAG: P-loop NTPase, partial [Rubripirellula sp.]
MSQSTTDTIRQAIGNHPDPETGRPIDSMGQILELNLQDHVVDIKLALSSHSMPIKEDFIDAIESKVVAAAPGITPKITLSLHERPPVRLGQIALRAKSVIAVGSGKGGVGKSTVAASIAVTLRRLGSKVGLMDADVYGPSIPQLLGLSGRPAVNANKKIEPIMLDGEMPVMSMGFLVEPDQAVIWRGPMLHGSINQFLADTTWGELDYLIIDMPPGTGDVALTISQ